MFDLSASVLLMIINIAVIAFATLGALLGWLRGAHKSIYALIANAVILLAGWLLMDSICTAVFDMDLSFLGLEIPLGDVSVSLTTVRNAVTEALRAYLFTGADVTATVTEEVILAAGEMVLKLVYFVLWIGLSLTVFKFISWLIWLGIRPRQRNLYGKMRRKKKTGKSRLLGAGIGFVHAALVTVLVFFLFAGAGSISDMVLGLTDGGEYDVVIVNNSATLMKTSSAKKTSSVGFDIPEEYRFVLETLADYRTQTLPGKVFGSIKIGGEPLDEYIFDGLLSMQIDDLDKDYHVNITLRKELATVTETINLILNEDPEFFTDFTVERLAALSGSTVNRVIASLSQLDTVSVVIPVGLEVVLYSELLFADDTVGSDIRGLLSEIDLEKMYRVSYANEFAKQGISINANAFKGCTALEEINLPNVSLIGPNAFLNCTSLKRVYVPNAEVSASAFVGCTVMNTLSVGKYNVSVVRLSDLFGSDSADIPKTLMKVSSNTAVATADFFAGASKVKAVEFRNKDVVFESGCMSGLLSAQNAKSDGSFDVYNGAIVAYNVVPNAVLKDATFTSDAIFYDAVSILYNNAENLQTLDLQTQRYVPAGSLGSLSSLRTLTIYETSSVSTDFFDDAENLRNLVWYYNGVSIRNLLDTETCNRIKSLTVTGSLPITLDAYTIDNFCNVTTLTLDLETLDETYLISLVQTVLEKTSIQLINVKNAAAEKYPTITSNEKYAAIVRFVTP